jgi:hypothetical protein
VHAARDAITRRACPAGIAVLPVRTVHRLRERQRDRPLPDTVRSRKQQALGHARATDGLSQEIDDRAMADD